MKLASIGIAVAMAAVAGLALTGCSDDEGNVCAGGCCDFTLSPIGLDDATSAGTARNRLEQAGVDLSGAENPHTGELYWHGGGELGLVEVSPSEGITTFEAGLVYNGGRAFVDTNYCTGADLYVEVQFTLSTIDGALAESWPVRAAAWPGQTGLTIRHGVELSSLSGTFTASPTSPEFPMLVTTVVAEFPEQGRHDGTIEIAPMVEETTGPNGWMMGGGAAPSVVAAWSTEPGGGATPGGPPPTGCAALTSDQECMDGGCFWEYTMDRCVER
jgi:hypothetical protein